MESNFSFDDISLYSSMEHNRAILRINAVNAIVNWSKIENIIMRNYPVGKSAKGGSYLFAYRGSNFLIINKKPSPAKIGEIQRAITGSPFNGGLVIAAP